MAEPHRPHIVVAEALQPEVIERLRQFATVLELADPTPEELIESVREADALVVRNRSHVTARVIGAAPRLRVIGRAGPSLDHIDVKAAQRHGITVVYTPEAQVQSAAEYTVAMLLTCARRIPWYDRKVREGQFESLRVPYGRELRNLTLGLLGGGAVCDEVARVFSVAFSTRILTHSVNGMKPHKKNGATEVEFDALLQESDLLSIHLPGVDGCQKIIGDTQLRLMKRTAHLVNTSRGNAVDNQSLGEALKTKRLAGAAVDVFDAEPLPLNHPLRNAPNCILTPHIAGSTQDVHDAYLTVADDVIRVLQGNTPLYPAPPRGK